MDSNRRQCIATLGAGALSLTLPQLARAQGGKTLRILVGFAPGGAADTVARAIGDGLRAAGYTPIVDNKAGAGGRLAIDAMLAAPTDGSTLLFTPSGNLTLFPHIYKKLNYAAKDYVPVAGASELHFGLAVNGASPVKTLAEFLAKAKSDPKEGAYGTPGAGTAMHFIGVMLGRHAQVSLTHVPYKGGAAAMTDLLGGQVPSIITTVPFLLPQHQAGKIRIIGVSSPDPLAVLPGVATFKSAGFPDVTVSEYFAFVARAGTPPAVVQQLSSAIAAAVRSEAVAAVLKKNDYAPRTMTAEELGSQLKADTERWGGVVKASGYTPED